MIVIDGHLNTKINIPSIADNGVGVAFTLELAGQLKNLDLKPKFLGN